MGSARVASMSPAAAQPCPALCVLGWAGYLGPLPAWPGCFTHRAHAPCRTAAAPSQVRELRLVGGDVIVSFGGANGIELAQAIPDVDALVAAYQRVINAYHLKWVDFDIEGGAVADTASVERRNAAIAKLQAANPGLVVSYCLPVLPIGLTFQGEALLASAAKWGVRVDEVSVMAMDYGDNAAPNPAGRMGYYAIQAAVNTRAQAQAAGLLGAQIGVIPMIGVNDVLSEVFTLEDACQLALFAATTPWVRTTSFWSVNRDNFAGFVGAAPGSSGYPQAPFDFAKVFVSALPGPLGASAWPTAAVCANVTLPQLKALPPALATQPKRLARTPAKEHNWQAWAKAYPGTAPKQRKVGARVWLPAACRMWQLPMVRCELAGV